MAIFGPKYITTAAAVMFGLLAATAEAAPRDDILRARALLAQCHYAEAMPLDRAAIGALDPKQADLALVAQQDLATAANGAFDFASAAEAARAGLAILRARPTQEPVAIALVSQNLAVALAGQNKPGEARALFASVIQSLSSGNDPTALLNAELAAATFEEGAGAVVRAQAHLTQVRALAGEPSISAALRAQAWLRLADADRRALRLDEAEQALVQASDAAAEAKLTPPRIALVRSGILLERGRLTEALATVAAIGSKGDFCDPTLAIDLAQRTGSIRILRREVPEAAAAFSSALGDVAALHIVDDPREAELVYGLAIAARLSRDFARSAALFDRAAEMARHRYGADSQAEAQAYSEKALMQGEAGEAAAAVLSARKAVAILSRNATGLSPLMRAYTLAAAGLSAQRARDFPSAKRDLRAALDAFTAARGQSFDLAPGLTALGEIALAEKQLPEADRLFRNAVAVQQTSGALTTLSLGTSYWRLSQVAVARGDQPAALSQSAAAVDVIRKRLAIGEAQPWNDAQVERETGRTIVLNDLALSVAGAPGEVLIDSPLAPRILDDLQLAHAATTGAAIAQMARRLQMHDPALDALLRRRNDLADEWRSLQGNLLDSLSRQTDPAGSPSALSGRQVRAAAELAEIDAQLIRADPKLDLLLKSRSVDLASIRAALKPHEALLATVTGDASTYVFVVTHQATVAYKTDLSSADLAASVKVLRQALDPAHWVGELPPMDTLRAFDLYRRIVAPASAQLADVDTIAFVPDDALASLPLGVLLTEPSPPIASDNDYAHLPWLVRRFATLTYPSVASLVALRAVQPDMASRSTMLGVGDPVFPGTAKQGGTPDAVLRALGASRLAGFDTLRQLPALPDTRIELGMIAQSIGAAKLLLGAQATETAVRTAPLQPFGVIVFATHGLIAGDLKGYAEPGLALSPPAVPSDQDDGLLVASEIANLKLRADWVILSACNTAAGDGSPKAEPLSGLAKSFFYAGARSLLVTNWAVESEAAARLTSETVRHTAEGQSPAQALRTTMMGFIEDKDGKHKTHPFFWAPFSLVGG